MSLPGWRLSSGISSSTGRFETCALLHSTPESVLEKTIFGSVFMRSPVGLFEPGHAFTMSSETRRPSTSRPVWPSSSSHGALPAVVVRP